MESIAEYIERLLREKNYVGAYLTLREERIDPRGRNEYTGRIVERVMAELSSGTISPERAKYLHSVAGWIFRDVPGLASLYREQLRSPTTRTNLLGDLVDGVRGVGDVLSGKRSLPDEVDGVVQDAKERIADSVDRAARSAPAKGVDGFFDAASEGLRGGLERLGEAFDEMNRREQERTHRMRQANPQDEPGHRRTGSARPTQEPSRSTEPGRPSGTQPPESVASTEPERTVRIVRETVRAEVQSGGTADVSEAAPAAAPEDTSGTDRPNETTDGVADAQEPGNRPEDGA